MYNFSNRDSIDEMCSISFFELKMFLSNAKLLQTKKILIKGYASGRRKTIKKERERENKQKKEKKNKGESTTTTNISLLLFSYEKIYILLENIFGNTS